jgi:hypothetical protein
VLKLEDPGGQARFRIPGRNGEARLGEKGPTVELWGYPMNACAVKGVSRGQGLAMGVQAPVRR